MNTTIPLTLTARYVPSWGTAEGLRELVQNWLDASDDLGTEGSIDHDGDTLTLINPGANIPRAAMLIGHTSKADRADQRGQHGEGLDVGTLALVRAGHTVEIHTGSERWTARIDAHPDLIEDVLVFDVAAADPVNEAVTVRVGNVTPEQYADMRRRFRRFAGGVALTSSHYFGDLLSDPTDRGRVFVKGIFIQDVSDLAYGYDFANVTIDRDRRLIGGWDLEYHASALVVQAMQRGAITPAEVYDIAAQDRMDTKRIANHVSRLDREALAGVFHREHGEKAIPVKDEHTRRDLAEVDVLGIVVPDGLRETLEPITGTAKEAREDAVRAPLRTYSVTNLTDTERAALLWAVSELTAVECPVPHVHIADFHDPKTMGQFRRGDIYVARWVLACRYHAIATLLHEVGHFAGRHGAAHNGATENVWTLLAARWHDDTAAVVADIMPAAAEEAA